MAQQATVLPGFQRIKRFRDQHANICTARILPGEYYVTNQHEAILTVLGSCVSACVRDTQRGIGGMNHFMLPMNSVASSGAWGDDKVGASTRYGNYAMESLINEILKHGGERKSLEVKVFGGGRILSHMTDIGRRNIEFVREYIEMEGLNLVVEDLGGVYPRKVRYFPDTGRAQVKKLRALHNDTVITREKVYMDELVEKPVEGEVTLF